MNGLRVYPNASAGGIIPTTSSNDVVIASVGTSLNIGCQSGTNSNGIRITPTTVVLGAGGSGTIPEYNIAINGSSGYLTLDYNFLQIATSGLPVSAGSSTGLFLPVIINGVTYKIALLSNS